VVLENVNKKKTSGLANLGDKFMASPNESEKLSNVDASVSVFKIPMALTGN
jgi:hypothetical protein